MQRPLMSSRPVATSLLSLCASLTSCRSIRKATKNLNSLRLCAFARVLLPTLTILLGGCKTTAPDWLSNPKTAYPESSYLVAVGEGDTRRAAENAAASNLARIFEAHIESDERLRDQTRESGKQFERTTDFTADISILSAQTLHNIQHAEAWIDQKGRVHAVAYLDRRETAGIYREKIDKLATRVGFLLEQAEQTDNLLKKYAALRAAARHAAENKLLLQQLKVIHPASARMAEPNYSENNLRQILAETAKQIRVQINIDGDHEKRITACLEELVTRYGFVVGKPAELKIEGRVEIRDTNQRVGDLVFVRYGLTAQIKDTAGNVLVSINEKGREGHVSLAETRIRSFRTLENAIKAAGANRLDLYFDSLVEQN